ncbi:2'-5' RNA ligase family protein, partial [Streptomyces sp. NPDC059766]
DYSGGDGPAAPVTTALAGLDLTPARARIISAELIVLHRDRQMYEWETYATVPLG